MANFCTDVAFYFQPGKSSYGAASGILCLMHIPLKTYRLIIYRLSINGSLQ